MLGAQRGCERVGAGQWRALLLLAALIGAWELYVDLGGADPLILPAPHAVASSMYDDRGAAVVQLPGDRRGGPARDPRRRDRGAGAGDRDALLATVRRAVYPLLIASQTIPIPMLAPVLVLWLGFGILPKLIVIALVSFFSIVITTLAGLRLGRPRADEAGAHVRHVAPAGVLPVELPTALPGVFTGAKIAVIVAVIGAVFAEQAGSNSGLGYVFTQAMPQLLTARAFAAVVILSLFAIALFCAADAGRATGRAVGPPHRSQIGEIDR